MKKRALYLTIATLTVLVSGCCNYNKPQQVTRMAAPERYHQINEFHPLPPPQYLRNPIEEITKPITTPIKNKKSIYDLKKENSLYPLKIKYVHSNSQLEKIF